MLHVEDLYGTLLYGYDGNARAPCPHYAAVTGIHNLENNLKEEYSNDEESVYAH